MNTEKKIIYIILIRHGLKSDNKSLDDSRPLSIGGCRQVQLLGEKLARCNLKPKVFFTSPDSHSKKTAELLIEQLQLGGEPIIIENLKRDDPIINFDQLVREKCQMGKSLEDLKMVAFVGQYPFLGQLQKSLTKGRIHQVIGRAEAACFQGTLEDFRNSNGQLEFRVMHDDEEKHHYLIEEQIRSKIRSTMTMSTFLAGFTFAVLNDFLQFKSLDMAQKIAAVCMTGSLLLFVLSMYLYDNMAMPKEYWSGRSDRTHFVTDHELLYHYMKRTWWCVFTPAVALALIGFIATLFNTGNDLMIVFGVVIILGVILYYFKMKPVLSPD